MLDKKANTRAIIDESLSIISTDEIMRKALKVETDFAEIQSGYIKPSLLVLFENLKTRREYKVKPSKGALRALKKKNKVTVIN